jgi:hypothetical protein
VRRGKRRGAEDAKATRRRLPIELGGEEFFNKTLIVRSEFLYIDGLVALAVEVVWVESLDCGEDLLILLVGKMAVGTFTMPWVEAVIADHCQGFVGKIALVFENVVEVLCERRVRIELCIEAYSVVLPRRDPKRA